ncbi:MAG: endonuclease [Flavobacteriales bacterium]|nr:MAG: endonuclease [Flavobacteriales bacterium]
MSQKNDIPDNLYSIAFYNLDNLFDTIDDPKTLDDEYTPNGNLKWNKKRYNRKLLKLGSVIREIGLKKTGFSPAIIGVAEVENRMVLKDLTSTDKLIGEKYGIIHYDSPDERGIEVAFLYRKSVFEVIDSKPYTLEVYNKGNIRDLTRDILYVKGFLQGELIYFLINHWPSRRMDDIKTEHKRIVAAQLNHQIITEIKKETPDAKIIIMGDFNDNPTNDSIFKHLVTTDFFNPFKEYYLKGRGSTYHEGKWHLFDQIIVNNKIMSGKKIKYNNAYIFNKQYLRDWKGKHSGRPFRTYIGKWFQGGYSDHFPVYITVAVT